jgi:hypothetical protein
MKGMDKNTGKALEDKEHLRQSITDILTTPLGSRVMRRDYGSRLFELVDHPTSPALLVDIYAATAEAIKKWEPRLLVESVQADTIESGKISLTLTGRYRPSGEPVTLEGIVV